MNFFFRFLLLGLFSHLQNNTLTVRTEMHSGFEINLFIEGPLTDLPRDNKSTKVSTNRKLELLARNLPPPIRPLKVSEVVRNKTRITMES